MKTTAHLQTDLLVDQYGQGVSASALAKSNGVSVWSVITRLRGAGVSIRSPKEQNVKFLAEADAPFTFREVVDGLMLGDGQIDRKSLLHLEQRNDRLGWVKQVQRHLSLVGCSSKLLPIPPRMRVIEGRRVVSKPATHMYTPAYEEMQSERGRWYPKGLKLVPEDLVVTPVVLTHWFCGDGTYNSDGHLTICTNGFRKQDTEFLVERIQTDLGVYCCLGATGRDGQYVIRFDRHGETMKIKELLLPLIDRSCKYKLRFIRPKKKWGLFSDEEVRTIRKLRRDGATLTAIGNMFSVSATAVSNIVNRRVYKEVIDAACQRRLPEDPGPGGEDTG